MALRNSVGSREFKATVAGLLAALRESDTIILGLLHQAQARRKPDGSEVTAADQGAERLLRACLEKLWPADAVMGEELGGAVTRSGRCWLIDPIDGTASYVLGMPMFGTLLGLLVDGEPVLGVVHLPALRETTYAASGHGCWQIRGGGKPRRVHVAEPVALANAKVGMTLFKERHLAREPGAWAVNELARRVGRLRSVGDCVQYPLLCRGVLDGAVDPRMKPWDIAALVPCVREAGGSISDLHGETTRIMERTSIVAASSTRLRRDICRQYLEAWESGDPAL